MNSISFPIIPLFTGLVSCQNNYSGGSAEQEILNRIETGGLANISPRQCSNKSYALAGVSRNGLDLALVSVNLRDDRDVVLAAVRQNGLALQYASQRLRANLEIILAAVRQNGLALQYVSLPFSRSSFYREAALAAVENNWKSFDYVTDYYRGDLDIALAAMAQDANAIYLVSPPLFNNQAFTRSCYNLSFGAYYYIYQTMSSLGRISALPLELTNIFQAMLSDLSGLNIEFINRFISATPLDVAEIIANRRALRQDSLFTDGRPVALVILPKTDRTNTFAHNNISQLIGHGYRVVYFEAEADLEVYEAIELTGQRDLISLLYLGGHGTAARTRLSGEYENEEALFLDPSDEAEMYYLSNYLTDNSRVLLYSCNACNGPLHQALERVFPQSTFFVPAGTPLGFNFIFDSQNHLIDVDFLTP